MKRKKLTLSKLCKRLICIFLLFYLLVCAFLFLFQDRFLFPLAYNHSNATNESFIRQGNTHSIEIPMRDGCILRGYQLDVSSGSKKNLLIYFGANAEDISMLIPHVSQLSDWSAILMNYRGYADSNGKPSCNQLYQDSEEIYDSVVSNSDYEHIAVMGRSIGSSVATYLASVRQVSGLIVISPFDSLTHVVRKKCPILPVSLVLKNKFETIRYAPNVTSPVYMLVGTKDWLVPNSLSQKVAGQYGSKVHYQEIPGTGHNTIDDSAEYWPLLERDLLEIIS